MQTHPLHRNALHAVAHFPRDRTPRKRTLCTRAYPAETHTFHESVPRGNAYFPQDHTPCRRFLPFPSRRGMIGKTARAGRGAAARSRRPRSAEKSRESKKTVCEKLSREPFLEAPPGFEPGSQGFADPCLTTWLWRRFPHPSGKIKNSAEIVFGAGNETRTRDIHLGKVTLYH